MVAVFVGVITGYNIARTAYNVRSAYICVVDYIRSTQNGSDSLMIISPALAENDSCLRCHIFTKWFRNNSTNVDLSEYV